MGDERTAKGLALLLLFGLGASGCDEPSRHRPGRELPLVSSRSIELLQPSADRERLFFLSDLDAKKETATLDVVTADGAFTPLAALVYQPAFQGEAAAEGSPWWDERPLHPSRGSAAFQLSADGRRVLALLQRRGRKSRLLAVFDSATGAMSEVASDVDKQGFQLDVGADGGVYFVAGSSDLYHVASPGQERVEIASALSPPALSRSPSGNLLTFSQGCAAGNPPRCGLALARADGSPARLLSEKSGERFGEVVFDVREDRLLFPEDVEYVYGSNRVLASIVSTPVEAAAESSTVRLAAQVQLGAYRFSPDGRWVTLLADPREDWTDPGPITGSLQLVPAAGGEPRTVAASALGESHFSPDGRRLYFLADPQRGVATLESVALPSGSHAEPDLTPTPLATRVAALRESPGGSKLLYLSDVKAGRGTLQLLSLSNGRTVRLGRDVILGSYRFSPEGRAIYWASAPSGSGAPDSVQRGALPYRVSDGAQLYGAAGPDWAPILLTGGLFEQKYYPSPDGAAVLSFPRVGTGQRADAEDAAAVLSFLDGTRVTLARGIARLWSVPDEPAFSPSGRLVAFFAGGHGDAFAGRGSGTLQVARVSGGEIVGQLDDVRTFAWLAGDHLDAVVQGKKQSLVALPLP